MMMHPVGDLEKALPFRAIPVELVCPGLYISASLSHQAWAGWEGCDFGRGIS